MKRFATTIARASALGALLAMAAPVYADANNHIEVQLTDGANTVLPDGSVFLKAGDFLTFDVYVTGADNTTVKALTAELAADSNFFTSFSFSSDGSPSGAGLAVVPTFNQGLPGTPYNLALMAGVTNNPKTGNPRRHLGQGYLEWKAGAVGETDVSLVDNINFPNADSKYWAVVVNGDEPSAPTVTNSFKVHVVPGPSSLLVLASGAVPMLGLLRRRRPRV